MRLTLLIPPAKEPVSLAEVKLDCRIEADETAFDAKTVRNVANRAMLANSTLQAHLP